MAICESCGKPFTPKEPRHRTCYDCFRKSQQGSSGGSFGSRMDFSAVGGPSSQAGPSASAPRASAPPSAIHFTDSFYGPDGFLRRAIFLEAADKAADVFGSDGMTQTSIRRLFDMLKAAERRLATARDKEAEFGHARETFFKFIRQVEYQAGRDQMKDKFTHFLAFSRAHADVASSSHREFRGFVEYLASIIARLRSK